MKKSNNYYFSIDTIPLYNWNKCLDGKKEYVRKNGNGSGDLDEVVWDMLYTQYIKTYGLGKVYDKMLKVMKKKVIYELEFVITNDRFKLTQIEMQETTLKNMMASANTGISSDQSLIYLSKWIGYWIQSKEITVKQYFDMLKEYERYNKSLNG